MSKLGDVVGASVRGAFFIFLGLASSTVIMAVTSILVARLLGPEEYGLYTIVWAVPSFLIIICDLGITPALTRFSAHFHREGKDREAANLIKTGVLFKIALSLIVSLLFIFTSEEIAEHILNRPDAGSLIRLASLYLIGLAVLNSVNSTFIGLDEAGKSSLLTNVQAVTKAMASPLLIILGLGVSGAIVGSGLGSVFAAAAGTAILLLRTYPRLQKGTDKDGNMNPTQRLKMMIHYGWPICLSNTIIGLQAQVRSLLMAFFASDLKIGNYATAMNFSVLISILINSIGSSLFPAFSKLDLEKDKDFIQKMLKSSVKYTALIVIFFSVALAILSKEVVFILYGDKYQIAPGYLALYMLTFLPMALGSFVIQALFNSQGDTRATFRINLVYSASSILLALLLIQTQGLEGLIVSIIVSELISTIYGLYLAHRMYKMKIDLISSLKILISSLSSALPVYVLLNLTSLTNPIYGLVLGGALYVASFPVFASIFKAVNVEDLENLESFTSRLPIIHPLARRILRVWKKLLNYSIFKLPS